ncbi:TRPV6 [Lepeophtheirus salmonis]|uniref:TRPV6 n=1 Tax=Lepeophtheirus salmonis TaxID=72036 RepID=A0A7R8D6X8_LEPSM|nr:TRPV6 [Lepeophtheirus salmonis]CAF3022188.1 TRPV6 [Lepeophtheirus salmonis]
MGACQFGGEQFDPGAVLDKVIASNTAAEDNPIYALANFKKGGELVQAFNKGGSKGVENFMIKRLPSYMYNHGKGEFITRTEFLRWKFRDNTKVSIGENKKNIKFDPLANWEDHEACWKMQYRGALGESILHILIICDTLVHTRIARIILLLYPKLALDKIEGEEYRGTTSLHLAIAYGNDEIAQVVVDHGADVNQKALGTFYLPVDQLREHPAKETNYEGLAYLGEFPLSWAACLNNETIYNVLIEQGADPDAQDQFGNATLHMVVITNQMGMFGYALKHPFKTANPNLVNNANLTCLTLSCKLGRDEIFREMLELSCKEFWRYSNICCSAYSLSALDSISPNGETNWGSAILLILAGTKEEHLNMLEGGVIAKLLEEKWTTYAKSSFYKRLAMHCTHVICLSLATYSRPETNKSLLIGIKSGSGDIDDIHIARYCFEISTILVSLMFLIVQQGEEIKNSGINSFFKNCKGNFPKSLFLFSNFCLLAVIPVRISLYFVEPSEEKTYRIIEESLLITAIPCAWFYFMFFAGAIELTGPFVTMIFSMITGDMFTFSIIYIITLFGFSQAFYFLQKGITSPGLYKEYITTWIALFHMTLGEYDYDKLSESTYSAMTKIIFVLFQIVIPILLLNMLIAMMGNTYGAVIEKSEKEFLKQWAKIIMSLERSLSPDKARGFLEKYSMKLGPNERGVMKIKAKDKTRARQRKGALANWKKTGKTIIKYLKKRKMTGDDLRREMWVHDVAETPKAKRKKGLGYDLSTTLPPEMRPDARATGIGTDTQTVGGGRPKPPRRTQEEIRQELFWKKRNRQNLNAPRRNSLDFTDLIFESDGETDHENETFLVTSVSKLNRSYFLSNNNNNNNANIHMVEANLGIVNNGFVPESNIIPNYPPPEYSVIDENEDKHKKKKKKKKMKLENEGEDGEVEGAIAMVDGEEKGSRKAVKQKKVKREKKEKKEKKGKERKERKKKEKEIKEEFVNNINTVKKEEEEISCFIKEPDKFIRCYCGVRLSREWLCLCNGSGNIVKVHDQRDSIYEKISAHQLKI